MIQLVMVCMVSLLMTGCITKAVQSIGDEISKADRESAAAEKAREERKKMEIINAIRNGEIDITNQ